MQPTSFTQTCRPPTEAQEPTCPQDVSSAHGDSLHTGCAHYDCILAFGPDVPLKAIARAESECLERGFSIQTFRTAGLQSVDDLRLQLHANGMLGPHTQIVLVFHGSRDEHGRHMLTLTSRGRQQGLFPTVETLRSLRRTGDAEAPPGECALWHGTMHLVTCEGGELEHEILPDTAAWREGDYLIYSGRNRLLVHEGMRALSHLFDCLAQCRNQDRLPDPRQMLAYAAYRAGDGLMLLGASVQGAVVVEAPMLTPENILQFHAGEWLKLRVHAGWDARHAFDGLRAKTNDAEEILSAMSAMKSASFPEQANLHEDKLKNVLLSAIGHQDLNTVSLLLAARPDLAEVRTLTGATLEELAWRDGNLAMIDAVLGARLAFIGPRPMLLQACARGDRETALRLLTMAPEGAFSMEDLTLAMQLASENTLHTYRFFEGMLEAARLPEHYLARQCLRTALEGGNLPLPLARQWKEWHEAQPQQRLDDARMLKVGATDRARAVLALADACREGDAILLDMLLQRFGIASASQADRLQLARLALECGNGSALLGRLLEHALLHGDVAMFRAAWSHADGREYVHAHGRLLLDRACMGNQVKVARYLLRRVEIDTGPDAHGDTPLHLAASSGSEDVVTLLLQMKHTIHQTNKAGNTALHVACRAGQDRIARQLAAAGAATDIRNGLGQTALDIAEAECSADTVALLGQASLRRSQPS